MLLITGAAGFLGSEVTRQALARGQRVRALVLPGDALAAYLPAGVEQIPGNLLSQDDLARFFDVDAGEKATVIHCASMITMSMKPLQAVYEVNVLGTQAIIRHCISRGFPLLHVGSVHAIPELPHGQVMAEPDEVDPDLVVGYYAKTKAMAVREVMDARAGKGLKASIVYPAGLSGPGDYGRGNLTQLFLDYMAGSIPMGVKGGYNFADVRDVAAAIVTLALEGRPGEDYVLSGEFISIMDILDTFREATGGKAVKREIPLWLAKAALPILGLVYKIRGVKPIFSAYSLYTVSANSAFDSGKARRDLGYHPRPIRQTLRDTAAWLLAKKDTQK